MPKVELLRVSLVVNSRKGITFSRMHEQDKIQASKLTLCLKDDCEWFKGRGELPLMKNPLVSDTSFLKSSWSRVALNRIPSAK